MGEMKKEKGKKKKRRKSLSCFLSTKGTILFLARILERVAMLSSRGSSPPRDRTDISYISCIGREVLYR